MNKPVMKLTSTLCRGLRRPAAPTTRGLLLLGALILSGCNWVQLTAEGQTVAVRQARDVGSCERIGRTQSQSANSVLMIERNRDKLSSELIVLARNEAATLGGNAIAAESGIVDGRQSFGVYRCP